MPIRDALLEFSLEQDLTGNAATDEESTNVVQNPRTVDHKDSAQDSRMSVDGELFLNVVVDGGALVSAVDGGGLTIELFQDTDTTTVTTDGNAIIAKTITGINTSTAHPNGTVLMSQGLPADAIEAGLAIKYSRITQNLASGKVTAWIGPSIQQG